MSDNACSAFVPVNKRIFQFSRCKWPWKCTTMLIFWNFCPGVEGSMPLSSVNPNVKKLFQPMHILFLQTKIIYLNCYTSKSQREQKEMSSDFASTAIEVSSLATKGKGSMGSNGGELVFQGSRSTYLRLMHVRRILRSILLKNLPRTCRMMKP